MQSNRPTLNPQNKRVVNLKTNKIKNSEIIASQPGKLTWTFRNDWEFGFCSAGCGSHDCCYACCCLPCYIAHLATMTKETTCIVCCVPLALMHLRTKIRTLLRINGSIGGDCLKTVCCPICAAVQMSREIRTI